MKSIKICQKIVESNGSSVTLPTPSVNLLKKYKYSFPDQEGVSFVKSSGACPQGARRQMASSSLRNLAAHIITTIFTSFVKGKYNPPEGLCKGASLAHKIIEDITGQEVKPIEPFQTGNCDMTTMFVWKGTASKHQSSNNWARVSTASQAKGERFVTSYYVNSEEVKCNGLTVKWCDGIFASGHFLPSESIFWWP